MAREAAAPYRVLGWDSQRRRIWFQHRQSAQISSTNPGPSFDRLLHLGRLEYWEQTFPADRRSGGVDWARAVSDLAAAADRAGVFDPSKVRGRGVWRDGGRIVWHLGDRLEVDGALIPIAAVVTPNRLKPLAAWA